MKIVTFSDIHGTMNSKVQDWFYKHPANLLLFAGDLQFNNYDDGNSFIDWLADLPYKNKILILGNHDGNYSLISEYINHQKYNNIIFLNNESVIVDNIKIFGSPYSVIIPNQTWWLSLPDEKLADIWELIPNDTDILLTHTPPYGILDKLNNGISIGSKTLLKRVKELKNLKYHVFGHIHESYGMEKTNNTTFINSSLMDEKYNMVNLPIIFDYQEREYNVGE